MHNPLPKSVRAAIAEIDQQINHCTDWVEASQSYYPGEMRWSVTGGNDWPAGLLVVITATTEGLVIEGEDELAQRLSIEETALRRTLAPDGTEAYRVNELAALRQVAAVVAAAVEFERRTALRAEA